MSSLHAQPCSYYGRLSACPVRDFFPGKGCNRNRQNCCSLSSGYICIAEQSKVLHFSTNYVNRFVQLLIGVYPGLIIKYVTGADTPSWYFICCPSAPACSFGMGYILYLYSFIIQFQRIFAILFSVFTKMSLMSSFDITRYKTIHLLKFMIQQDHIRPQSRYRYHPCV